MPGYKGNLRDATFSTSSGKPVRSTSQLSNGARRTKAENATNSTTEYKIPGGAGSGPYGGKNSMK